MTPDDPLLEKLARWRPDSSAPDLDFEASEGVRVRLRGESGDALAARLWEVRLTRATAPSAPLAERALRLARRITGLLEPLRLVEVADVAQLRSDAPVVRGEERHYYEVLLHADGAASVQRFAGSRTGAARRSVPFTLTHEALGKLVEDLAD
jgi:hypothetical protein